MSKSPGRQARSPAPDASQIKAVRRAMDAGHLEQARQRLVALRKTFPEFKPLLGLGA